MIPVHDYEIVQNPVHLMNADSSLLRRLIGTQGLLDLSYRSPGIV